MSEELDRKNGVWTLPKERTKNKREHTLVLADEAWKIIGPPSRTGPLFGRGGGRYTGFQGFKRTLDKRCNLVKKWVLHDIRRSVATGMANIGIQPHIIETVLNHISGHKGGIAGIYNRSNYEHEVASALADWARYVALVIDDELHAAHEKFLAADGDKEAQKEARNVFRNAIADTGAWERYLRMIVGGKADNVIEMRSKPIPA